MAQKDTYKILRMAANASTLQEICNYAYKLLDNPIFIEDRASVKLAYSKNAKVDDPSWQSDIVQGTHLASTKPSQVKDMQTNYANSSKNELPIISHDDFMPVPRMVKILKIKGMHVATIVAVGYFREFTSDDQEIMEILSTFVKSHLENEKFHLSPNQFAIENFLIRMLNGERFSAEAVKEHFKLMNWNNKAYNYIFDVFHTDESQEDTPYEKIIEDFSKINQCYPVTYDNHLVVFYRTEDKFIPWNNEDFSISKVLRKYHLSAGVSQAFQNANQVEERKLQAQCMSDVASVLKNNMTLYPYDEFSSYHMMEIAEQKFPLKQFCHQKILDLEEYDTVHNTDLIPTLHIYLESYRSISHTAEVMYIHRNTVSYRINKCFELLGTRIENGTELYAFTFSLRILEYYNKKNGKMPPFQIQ